MSRKRKKKRISHKEREYPQYHIAQAVRNDVYNRINKTLKTTREWRKRRRDRRDLHSRLEDLNDDREFRPQGAGPKDIYGQLVRYSLRDIEGHRPGYSGTKARIGFEDPRRVSVCRRRNRRREHLFRIGKAGRGIKGPRVKYKNEYSDVRC